MGGTSILIDLIRLFFLRTVKDRRIKSPYGKLISKMNLGDF